MAADYLRQFKDGIHIGYYLDSTNPSYREHVLFPDRLSLLASQCNQRYLNASVNVIVLFFFFFKCLTDELQITI